MNEASKERRAGRGNPRPSGLTLQAVVQMAEALALFRSGQHFFARLRRCSPLNMLAYPAGLRLAGKQTSTALCGKIIESGP